MSNAPSHPLADTEEAGQDLLRICILDDAETDRMRMKRLCRRAGLLSEISEVSSVEGFRSYIAKETADIFFLDYSLGIDTGLDALDAINADERHADSISIMVSSLDDLNLAIEAMRRGCADYINKEELSVDAIRKSLALAFERRLLLSSLKDAREGERAASEMLSRIGRMCGSEIRAVIFAALEQLRDGEKEVSGQDKRVLSESLGRLDRLLKALGTYIDAAPGDGSEQSMTSRSVGPRLVEQNPT